MAVSKRLNELTGLGTGGGELEKLEIEYETGRPAPDQYAIIKSLFNPNEINISKAVTWQTKRCLGRFANITYQEFRSSEPRTLTLDLFFDTYEPKPDQNVSGHLAAFTIPTNPLTSAPQARDVTDLTKQVAALAEVNRELHRPPHCKLMWGNFHIFNGILTNIQQRFTMFMPNGMPVRATLSCEFAEYITVSHAMRARELHSADVAKTHIVRRHDTLHSLAAEAYNDPGLWRIIAQANGITNPRHLVPGKVLVIPPLQP